jgi:hypothetical protein
MYKRWAALAFVLALCALAMQSANAQATGAPKSKLGGLGKNYPNPFNPETTISFNIGDSLCTDATQHIVSLNIFNLLSQKVASPRLQTPISGGVGSSGSVGQYLTNVRLSCGKYTAYWDGKYQAHPGQSVASSEYIAELVIDGKIMQPVLRMLVTK